MEIQKIVIVGCGNVASYFAERFKQLNFTIVQVYHPEISKANAFAKRYNATGINDLLLLNKNADLYFIAVKDSAIAAIATQMPTLDGLVVHTSGSVKLDALNKHKRSAVFYPLQTFTKGIETANTNFPILIECNQQGDENYLTQLANLLGNSIHTMSSAQRIEIHLAAVFAANFTNHCIKIAYDLMLQKNHEASMLLPLIKESIHKLNYIEPVKAQTGPAIRNDKSTIDNHLLMLKDDVDLQTIYELLSKNIQSTNQ